MVYTDTLFHEYQTSINEFRFDNENIHYTSNNQNFLPINPNPPTLHSNPEISSIESPPSSITSPDADHTNQTDYVQVVLKYINDMLMEEDLEGQTCMLQSCLALQAAEKSFYEVLNQKDPPSQNQTDTHHNNSVESDRVVRKFNHNREDDDDDDKDGRSNKHLAFSLPEIEPPDLYDDVLLCKRGNKNVSSCLSLSNEPTSSKQVKGSTRSKRRGNKEEVVDLPILLTQCAQAVAGFDQRTATELLKKIRQHCNQFGNGTQRMAYYFASSLEARLSGTKTPTYSPLVSDRTSAADILKAYQVYVTACPFKKMSNFLANKTIMKLVAQARSTTLHIIDFGILYGFQWPCLIQNLADMPGGPPKLRITGIDLPQPGFRPTERVEETGNRLKRYCDRFGVPFEYFPIAKKWETIQIQDLKLEKHETTIVNCLYRMKNIPDDTVVVNSNSPRDTVLKLINQIKPDVFIHGVVNGTYNAPFFVTRFREALYHFSALFDMFEATMPREDRERMLYEREIFNRDSMNVIACEGTERVERPETFKQWNVRNLRAGLRRVGLDEEVVKKVKGMVKSSYHRDFVIDVDGEWMLQGWKGRVICALSCWKPANK